MHLKSEALRVKAMRRRPQCEYCSRRPSYGLDGNRPRWCKRHALDGAKDVVNPRCQHTGCDRRPTFGMFGGRPQWCSAHKLDGASDIVNKRCLHLGCARHPVFGTPGGRPRWCAEHKPAEARDVVNKRCQHDGCMRRAKFGMPGERPMWCTKHKADGAENITGRRCNFPNCKRTPVFGMPGGKPTWCCQHKADGAEDVVNKRCQHPNCPRQPSFGLSSGRPIWCYEHKAADAEDVVSKRCGHFGCDISIRGGQYCANHDTSNKRRTRVREHQVANYLRERGLLWTAWNKQLAETACGRYRPDFVYELPTHVVIVEVDEHQHAQPGYACDAARMLDVYNSYGGLAIIFIRFNPDQFCLGSRRGVVSWPKRLHALDVEVRRALITPPTRPLIITRMFYNSEESTITSTWADPYDHSFVERTE